MTNAHDILIVGGGLTGPALALALAQAGLRSAVIDALPQAVLTDAGFDGRSYALALGSQRLLKALGIWGATADEAQPILDIEVSDGQVGQGPGPFGLAFDHAETEDGPMGYLVEDRHVRRALLEAMAAEPRITVINDATVVAQSVAPGRAVVTLADGTELDHEQLLETLKLLEQLDKYGKVIRKHGGDFGAYVEKANPETRSLPDHLIKIRDGNKEWVEYVHGEEAYKKFCEENADLFGEDENGTKTANGNTRRATAVNLYESKAIEDILHALDGKGFSVDYYSAQDNPLFEFVDGDKVKPLFSIPEILEAVKESGRQGMTIGRFKGLGEMNAKELYETTMNPANRKLLRIDIPNAIEAEEMFTKLMGDEVPPRRQFIEDEALNVRNLDI